MGGRNINWCGPLRLRGPLPGSTDGRQQRTLPGTTARRGVLPMPHPGASSTAFAFGRWEAGKRLKELRKCRPNVAYAVPSNNQEGRKHIRRSSARDASLTNRPESKTNKRVYWHKLLRSRVIHYATSPRQQLSIRGSATPLAS